jgi:voltage-gated potassium channel
MPAGLRLALFDILGEGQVWRRAHAAATAALLALIAFAVGVAALHTVPAAAAAHDRVLTVAQALASLAFTAEYLLRLWVAADAASRRRSAAEARLRYALSFLGLVDLVVVVPFLLEWVLPVEPAWSAVADLLALLKLARYTPGLGLVAQVVRNEARALYAALVVLVVMLLLASGAMYALEHEAQPALFASIPHALWWGIVTMGTVGYGDVVPVTGAGRLVAGFIMVLGIGLFALPAGILATGFATELRRRDFLVTWRTVASVPLFRQLDAGAVASIARLLRVEIVPAFSVVVRRGDAADSMYFIMSGEVEVDVAPKPVRLRAGQFFGEIALLTEGTRTATVTALRDCRLLSLAAADFRRLAESHPDIAASVARVADERRKALAAAAAAPA